MILAFSATVITDIKSGVDMYRAQEDFRNEFRTFSTSGSDNAFQEFSYGVLSRRNVTINV